MCADRTTCRQVWANCRLYNQDESDISQLANDLARQFLAAWQDCGLPVVPMAAAPQLQPAASPAAKPELPAAQLAADGGTQRSFRRGQSAEHVPQEPTVDAPGAQPAAPTARNNGHAQHKGPGGKRKSVRRQAPAPVAASSANGVGQPGVSALPLQKHVEAPVMYGVSTDKAGSVQRRPSLKVMLRPAGVSNMTGTGSQKQVQPYKKLTVKLRASSADVRKLNPESRG